MFKTGDRVIGVNCDFSTLNNDPGVVSQPPHSDSADYMSVIDINDREWCVEVNQLKLVEEYTTMPVLQPKLPIESGQPGEVLFRPQVEVSFVKDVLGSTLTTTNKELAITMWLDKELNK